MNPSESDVTLTFPQCRCTISVKGPGELLLNTSANTQFY